MKWRCKVCRYIHEGEEPPLECPVCHAGSYAFERVGEPVADVEAKDISLEGISRRLVEEILMQAITKENGTYNMYLNAAKIIKDAAARELVNKMADEESLHVSWLEKLGAGFLNEAKIRKIKLLGADNSTIGTDFSEDASLQNVLDIAIRREQWAYEFYSSMAKFVDQKEIKYFFIKLAKEELKHKLGFEKFRASLPDRP